MTKSAIKVYLFDEHKRARETISEALQQYPTIDFCGSGGSIDEMLFHLGSLEPDVVLYEVKMANRQGIEALKKVRAYTPAARLIVATSYPDKTEEKQVMRLGADGYWNQQQGIQELYQMIITKKKKTKTISL